MHPEEERLLQLSRSGDTEAFGQLIAIYEGRVYRTAYMLTGRRDDALDVAQEAFLKAFRNIRAFRGDCAFSTWLHRITINAARNYLRSAKSGKTIPESEALTETRLWDEKRDSPEQSLLQKEAARELMEALNELPSEYREALVLRVAHELPYSEIAEVLEIPIGTVRSRLSKARELLLGKLRYRSFLGNIGCEKE